MGDPQSLRDVLADAALLLTPEEAAKALRVGRTTIYALMKAGELHPVHIGRCTRISRAQLERYVRGLEAPPVARPHARRRRRIDTNQSELFELRTDAVDEP